MSSRGGRSNALALAPLSTRSAGASFINHRHGSVSHTLHPTRAERNRRVTRMNGTRREVTLEMTTALARLETERARLDDTLAGIDDAAMTEAGAHGPWSVKDVIAHIAAWDRRGLRWIDEAVQGGVPQIPEPEMSFADMDRLNEQTFVEHRDRPLVEVLAEFRDVYRRLLARVRTLTPEDLARSFSLGQPEVPDPMTVDRLVAWRWQHYAEHGDAIRRWVAQRRSDASAGATR